MWRDYLFEYWVLKYLRIEYWRRRRTFCAIITLNPSFCCLPGSNHHILSPWHDPTKGTKRNKLFESVKIFVPEATYCLGDKICLLTARSAKIFLGPHRFSKNFPRIIYLSTGYEEKFGRIIYLSTEYMKVTRNYLFIASTQIYCPEQYFRIITRINFSEPSVAPKHLKKCSQQHGDELMIQITKTY